VRIQAPVTAKVLAYTAVSDNPVTVLMVVRTADSEKPVKSRSLDRTGLRLLLELPDSEAGLNDLLVANDGFDLLREFPFVRTATLHCSLVPFVVKNDHGVVDVVAS
jgi:hypothetical protein